MITELVERMIREGQFAEVVNNPLAQFGTPERRYLGATILPETQQPLNVYREEGIRFRTIIAAAGDRYSPAQRRKGVLMSSFLVELAESDTADELDSKEYDTLLRLLQRSGRGNVSMEAMTRLISFTDRVVNLPLIERNEYDRWQSIVDAQVIQRGDNKFIRTIDYANPSGHRVAESAQWSLNATDPYDDIIAGKDLLASKGYTVNRIFAGTSVVSKLSRNEKIRTRVGRFSITDGAVTGISGSASLARINELLSEDELPPIERYDLQYRTLIGSGYFLKRDVFVMIATTGRDQEIDFGDAEEVPPLSNTLGYTGIGTPAGQESPGRAIYVAGHQDKPPRINAQGWQTSLPVVTEPEAIFVINSIT